MKDLNKDNIKIIIYASIFVVALVAARVLGSNLPSTTDKNQSSNSDFYIKLINQIEETHYKEDIYIYSDYDCETLSIEKQSDLIIGKKKYKGELTEYFKYNDKYYTYDNESFLELNNFKEYEMDDTLTKLSTIKALLALKHESIDGGNSILLTFDLNDVVNLYNIVNNKEVVNNESKDIKVVINYEEENIKDIELDLTNLYNLIDDKYEFVNYKLIFTKNKEEDISFIVDKL